MTVCTFDSEHLSVSVELSGGWYEVVGPEGVVTRFRSLARAERCARRVAEMLP